jgi:hypothetical protein
MIGLLLQIAGLLLLSALDSGWSPAARSPGWSPPRASPGIAKDFTKTASKSAIKATAGGVSGAALPLGRLVHRLEERDEGPGVLPAGCCSTRSGSAAALWLMARCWARSWSGRMAATAARPRQGEGRRRACASCSPSRPASTCWPRRGCSCSARATCGSWSACRCSSTPRAGASWRSAASWPAGRSPMAGCRPWRPMLVPRSADGLSRECRARAVVGGPPGRAGDPTRRAISPLRTGGDRTSVVTCGLTLFAVAFAVNSSLHSYLILAYAGSEKAAEDVGFYYAANACGRLAGTLLSGLFYQAGGIVASASAARRRCCVAMLGRHIPATGAPGRVPASRKRGLSPIERHLPCAGARRDGRSCASLTILRPPRSE